MKRGKDEKVITVKEIDFYYDSKSFEITQEVLDVLNNFPHEEDEDSFYMYWNDDLLIIY